MDQSIVTPKYTCIPPVPVGLCANFEDNQTSSSWDNPKSIGLLNIKWAEVQLHLNAPIFPLEVFCEKYEDNQTSSSWDMVHKCI